MTDPNTRAHRFATALVGAARAAFHRLGHTATIACAYGAIAIVTFGHSASSPHECFDRVTGKVGAWCPYSVVGPQAFAAAVLWPLYWSWELQS